MAITLPHLIPLLLVVSTLVILNLGLLSFILQVAKTRLYLKNKLGKKTTVPPEVAKIAFQLHLGGKIDIIKEKESSSFCYGLFRPRICLTSGLINKLSSKELKAVLLHEKYHLINYDPLKIMLSKAVSLMFFFIPSFKDIHVHFALSKEIAADELAIMNGYKTSLISVLSKLLKTNNAGTFGVAALISENQLEKRILYLTGHYQKTFTPSFVNIFISIIVLIFSFLVINAPVQAVGRNDQSECSTSLKTFERFFSEYRLY